MFLDTHASHRTTGPVTTRDILRVPSHTCCLRCRFSGGVLLHFLSGSTSFAQAVFSIGVFAPAWMWGGDFCHPHCRHVALRLCARDPRIAVLTTPVNMHMGIAIPALGRCNHGNADPLPHNAPGVVCLPREMLKGYATRRLRCAREDRERTLALDYNSKYWTSGFAQNI